MLKKDNEATDVDKNDDGKVLDSIACPLKLKTG
jgi:hypothetical protein